MLQLDVEAQIIIYFTQNKFYWKGLFIVI